MMNCKEYIFKLTSGQLEDAGRLERFWGAQHRLMCRRCRAFSANNDQLSDILKGYKEKLTDTGDDTKLSHP